MCNMMKAPNYNGIPNSWIWLDKEFVKWFAGTMSGTIDICDTPSIRAIAATNHEQAFTKYIQEVGEYLINIAEFRKIQQKKRIRVPQLKWRDIEVLDISDDYSVGYTDPNDKYDLTYNP